MREEKSLSVLYQAVSIGRQGGGHCDLFREAQDAVEKSHARTHARTYARARAHTHTRTHARARAHTHTHTLPHISHLSAAQMKMYDDADA
jgi:hypothetical protein